MRTPARAVIVNAGFSAEGLVIAGLQDPKQSRQEKFIPAVHPGFTEFGPYRVAYCGWERLCIISGGL